MSKSTVVFAIDVTTEDGKNHAGGSTATIPSHEARELAHWGRARIVPQAADTEPPADPSTSDSGASTKGKK